MKLRILKGNIIDATTDAIVLPANSQLKVGKGASEAIFKAAGKRELAKKCKEIGFCEVGSAVPTYGFDLGCVIIHAVVPKWIDGKHNEYERLSSAYYSSLQVADAMKLKSITFPLLASGNNGFELELAFEIAIKTIESFTAEEIEEVVIVLFGNRIASIASQKGYEVGVLPRNIEQEEKEYLKKKKKKEKVKDFAEDQIDFWLDYFKNPQNCKDAIDVGKRVANVVLKAAAKFV